MAEAPNQPPAPLPTAEEVAEHNAAIAAKVASQDAAGNPTPDLAGQKTAGDALDAIAAAAEEAAKKKAEAQPAVAPKAEDEAAKKAAADKEAAAKAAKEEEAKKADDVFKAEPQLPPNASPKSHEAFSAIKVKAAQEISKLSAELEQIRKDHAALKEQAGKPSVEQEQILKENKELREWRAKLDVEADPKFKEFDKEAEGAREFIYAQLRKSSVIQESTIEAIKKFGGPDKIKMQPIFDALKDETAKRLIEAELATIEKSKYRKEQAIAQTKTNIQEYLEGKNKELSTQNAVSSGEVLKEMNESLAQLEWTKPQTYKQGATKEEIEKTDAYNKFITDLRKELEVVAADNSPKVKATLLVATAQLLNLQVVHKNLRDAHTALEAEVKELRTFKDKIKQGTRSRLPESQAPAAGTQVQKPQNIFNTNAADGLDAAAKEVMAKRAAVAA